LDSLDPRAQTVELEQDLRIERFAIIGAVASSGALFARGSPARVLPYGIRGGDELVPEGERRAARLQRRELDGEWVRVHAESLSLAEPRFDEHGDAPTKSSAPGSAPRTPV